MIVFQFPLFQNLTEKIEQKSGSISSGTYTGINLDWVSYDETQKKLLLHKKGTGADSVIPFSGGLATDINPSKTDNYYIIIGVTKPADALYSYLPVQGYKNCSLKVDNGGLVYEGKMSFVLSDSSEVAISGITAGTWKDYVVPDGAMFIKSTVTYGVATNYKLTYSLTV